MSMEKELLNWFATGRVGASAKAMACCFLGVAGDVNHPHDPDDFNRCLLLLKAAPSAKKHMKKLRGLSPTWARLVDNWKEIEASFLDEAGLDWCKDKRAPWTYRLMRKVIDNKP